MFGIPAHAWTSNFFVGLVDSVGSFVYIDEHTSKREHLDIARIMVKLDILFKLPDFFKGGINEKEFTLIFREDNYGSMRLVLGISKTQTTRAESSDLEDKWSNILYAGEDDLDTIIS